MERDRTIDYRRALEALRNGVPNRDAVSVLGSSQSEAESAFSRRLSSVESSAKQGEQVSGLLIAGGFGAGKSHLLDYFEHLAISKNFVCSRVTIGKETPLFDPAKLYSAAIDGARVPGASGEAIREMAPRLQPGSRSYGAFSEWVGGAKSGLSDRFTATLALYENFSHDPEAAGRIADFWSGDPLPVSWIRQGLKQIHRAGSYSLKPVKARDLALQRFQFAARLIAAAGYSGWVLLADEVELVGRYSVLQRGKSYAELARLMGRVEGHPCPGLMTVAAITDDFSLAVLHNKCDREAMGTKLRAKETDEYNAIASRAETGMRLIEREALTLQAPSEATLKHTYRRLKEIHGKAYGWDPPELPVAVTATTRRMRSYVRRWVNEWDLRRLYPGAELSMEEEAEFTLSYAQDAGLEGGPETDDEG